MTPQMILDKMDQLIRLGFVNARQPEKMRVKVTLRDTPGGPLVTDWLPVLCPRASGDMRYDLPDVGDALAVGESSSLTDSDSGSVECLACYLIAVSIRNFLRRNGWSQVLCLFLPYGLEQGFVVGSMYGRQVPPVQNADKWHRAFKDGTALEYDRAAHTLTAHVMGGCDVTATGSVTMKAQGPITLEAPVIYVRGTLVNTASDGSPGKSVFSGGMEVRDGGVNVAAGDVVASGVSLTSHTTEGVTPGGGTSSHPTGGSPESPGTASRPLPEPGTAAYAAAIEHGIMEAAEKIDALPQSGRKKISELILCLPEIADAMAARKKNAGNQADAEGWAYLAGFFRQWLSTKVVLPENGEHDEKNYGPQPLFISWEWLDKYPRISEKVGELKKNLITPNLIRDFTPILKADGFISNETKEFDYIPADLSDTGQWRVWERNHQQHIPVPGGIFEYIRYGADGLVASMGSFSLRAIPRGRVVPLPGGGHEVTITAIAVYAADGFNFADDTELSFWNCEEKMFYPANPMSGTLLKNSDFRIFRKYTGHGGNFYIFSVPRVIDGIKGASYVTPL